MSARRRCAAVAGGGVGGLASALALARSGWEVRLFERAPQIAEVGAGLQLGPNGARALEALGLLEPVRAGAFAPEAILMRHGVTGARITEMPLGEIASARWGEPYLVVHRADLIATLQRALEEVAPGAVTLGAEVAGYEAGSRGSALRLLSGDVIEADLIIGADGLRSAIRTQMLGPEAPRFTGCVAWRATIPASRARIAPVVTAWAGAGRHAVTYPLRGGAQVNFVGLLEQDWREESWTAPGDPAALAAAFVGWTPELTRVINAIETPFRWALHDRAPLPRWSEGAVTLLGDSCHPMLPSLAQGAAQALEDAVALAERLETAADIPAALEAHYAARIERVSRVQREARANLARFHRDDLVTRLGARAIHALAPGWFLSRLDWLYAA